MRGVIESVNLDERSKNVFDTILNDPMIKGSEIEKKFSLTRKQLSYTLEKINDVLKSEGYPRIERKKTGTFIVPKQLYEQMGDQMISIDASDYVLNEEERIRFIEFILLSRTERLSLYHFISMLKVSKNTILNDMKKAQMDTRNYGIDIQYDRENGYRFIGSELDKRRLLIDLVHPILLMSNGSRWFMELTKVTRYEIETNEFRLSQIEKELDIRFTDEVFKELPYIVSMILLRIKQHKDIGKLPLTYQSFVGTREYQVSKILLKDIPNFSQQEHLYMTLQLLTSNFFYLDMEETDIDQVIYQSVKDVIDNFEILSCIKFKDKEQLAKYLFQHWKPAYYRIKYNFHMDNPMKDIIETKYQYLHDLIKKVIYPFENSLNKPIPDMELGYITILIGGWLRKEGQILSFEKGKRAIVVCSNGVTVSNFLFMDLKNMLPYIHFLNCYSIRDYMNCEEEYDIIFSTTYIKTDKQLFLVEPFINEYERKKFIQKVNNELIGFSVNTIQMDDVLEIVERYAKITDRMKLMRDLKRYLFPDQPSIESMDANAYQPCLAELLPPHHILVANVELEWEKAIRDCAEVLVAEQMIEQRYVETIITSIKTSQPYIMIADGVIVAHAGVDQGVREVCMSMLKMDRRIKINNYLEADVIIVLATPNVQRHLKALAQLNDMLDERFKQLKQAKTKMEILECIKWEEE